MLKYELIQVGKLSNGQTNLTPVSEVITVVITTSSNELTPVNFTKNALFVVPSYTVIECVSLYEKYVFVVPP